MRAERSASLIAARERRRTSRARRARPASSAMIVSVTSVRRPERRDLRLERGIDGRRGRTRRATPARSAADARALDLVAERAQHPVGRALERPAADDRRSPRRPARPGRAPPAISSRDARARPGSARSTRSGSTAPMTIDVGGLRAPPRPRPSAGRRSIPAKRTSRTSGAWCRWTKYSWKSSQPSSVRTWVRTGSSVIGRIASGTPRAAWSSSTASVSVAAGPQPRAARDVRREVAVAEPEPGLLAVLARARP